MPSMDLALLVVSIGSMLIAAISAIIAWKQTALAISAKDDAETARDAASRYVTAAEVSAGASQRSASALERHATAVEAQAKKAPWAVKKVSEHRWEITNQTGFNVDFVSVQSRPEGLVQQEWTTGPDVPNQTSIFLRFGGGLTDPVSVNATLQWRPGDSEMAAEMTFTLS